MGYVEHQVGIVDNNFKLQGNYNLDTVKNTCKSSARNSSDLPFPFMEFKIDSPKQLYIAIPIYRYTYVGT